MKKKRKKRTNIAAAVAVACGILLSVVIIGGAVYLIRHQLVDTSGLPSIGTGEKVPETLKPSTEETVTMGASAIVDPTAENLLEYLLKNEETSPALPQETTTQAATTAPTTAASTTAAPTVATSPVVSGTPVDPELGTFNDGVVHALTQEELNAIKANYDCESRSFGGTDFYKYVAERQQTADTLGNVRMLLPHAEGEKIVALTFPEGRETGYTGQLLDILDSYGVTASFYVTYHYTLYDPQLVQRMIDEGHDVGSHTYICPDYPITYLSIEEQMVDAIKMQKHMEDTFGYTMHVYNFNSGEWSYGSAHMLSNMGYIVALCSVNWRDWEVDVVHDYNTTLQLLKDRLQPGSIYSLHVTNPITVEVIGPFIEYCLAQGYEFRIVR